MKKFILRQYAIIFLIITLSAKLIFFSSLIGIDYPFYYMRYGYACSAFIATLLLYPLVFLPKKRNLVAIMVSLTSSVILLLDLTYFRFFQALPTFGLLSAINQTGDIAPSALSLLSWNDLLLFIDVIAISLTLFFINRRHPKVEQNYKIGMPEKIFGTLLLIATILAIFTFRYVEKPRAKLANAFSASYETRVNVQNFGILGGHLIDGYRYATEIFTTIKPEDKAPVVAWVKANLINKATPNSMTGTAKGKRVIMIQVESLGEYVMGKQIDGQDITPNLNKIASESHYYSDNRFVIGAGHTSDTDFVANTSIYPLYDSSAFVRYGNDDYTGLAKTLAENGYSTAAYHAYNRSFWNRSTAFDSLGYQKFYAQESYPKGEMFNIYGLNDVDFFRKTAEYIAATPEKSLSYTITLSSHYPFEVNATTKVLDLEGANLPEVANGYLQNIHYADAAIGVFVEELRARDLYDESLIVVYGDHDSPNVETFSANGISYNPNSPEATRVPLIIKAPGQTMGTRTDTTATMLDIVPTILDLLGIKSSSPMFGESLFTTAGTALPRCTGGEVMHTGPATDCPVALPLEKSIAEKMIKYNIFGDLK